MNTGAFFDNEKIKNNLIKRIVSTRFIKETENFVNFELEKKIISLRARTLTNSNLEISLSDITLEYQLQYNIPLSLSCLIEGLYQEMSNPKYLTFPETIFLSIKTGSDLSLIWYSFAYWFISEKQTELKKWIESIELLECIEEIEEIYSIAKNKIVEMENNREIFEDITHNSIRISKKIESLPPTETSMIVYGLNYAIIEPSYIYDIITGIYKHSKMTDRHADFYSDYLLNLLKTN